MRVKIRLYKIHDYDLYSLYDTVGHKRFAMIAKEILTCYTEGKPYTIPHITINDLAGKTDMKHVVACNLTFNDHFMHVQDMLNNIVEDKRNSFIKMLMRVYLADILSQIYLEKDASVPTIAVKSHVVDTVKQDITTTDDQTPVAEPVTEIHQEQPVSNTEDAGDDLSVLSALFGNVKAN